MSHVGPLLEIALGIHITEYLSASTERALFVSDPSRMHRSADAPLGPTLHAVGMTDPCRHPPRRSRAGASIVAARMRGRRSGAIRERGRRCDTAL